MSPQFRGPGILTALTQPSPDALRTAIRETKAATDKPFCVNITLLPTINPPDYEVTPVLQSRRAFGSSRLLGTTSAERMGVDVISIDGFECAGYPGEEDIRWSRIGISTELTVPYIASGGFADGRGLAAAIASRCGGYKYGHTLHVYSREPNPPQHQGDNRRIHRTRYDPHLRTLNNTARVFKNQCAKQVVALDGDREVHNSLTYATSCQV
ncbi:hypothetical protein BU15DRAFT_63943 [Melanogaster broomeanus]|nr:hypothetical protein BU15DRAFT_63943 [Melanogaster broomeanus]